MSTVSVRPALEDRRDTVRFLAAQIRLWLLCPIPEDIRSGSFSQDPTGAGILTSRAMSPMIWWLARRSRHRSRTERPCQPFKPAEKIGNPRHVRRAAAQLARAQRAGRKKLARKIHRKVAAQRRHFLHVTSTRIVRENVLICVGDVNSAALARTRMAKSVLDAGWSAFCSMLRYKQAMRHGARFVDTNERYSTQVCSDCGTIGGPRGLKDLGVRSWSCDDCGSLHDRDTNAAQNILRSGRNVGLQLLEIPAL